RKHAIRLLTADNPLVADTRGLEPQLGALQHYRPGRPSLACDLIEPLRVPAVDRWLIALCNQDHVGPDDFHGDDSRGGRLRLATFPAILLSWENHAVHLGVDALFDRRPNDLCARFRTCSPPLPTPGTHPKTGPSRQMPKSLTSKRLRHP